MRFAYVDTEGVLRTARVKVNGGQFEGTLSLHGPVTTPIKGVRQ